MPVVNDPVKFVRAAVGETEPGAADDVAHIGRDKNLSGGRLAHRARRDVNIDATQLAVQQFALADVDARPNLDAQLPHRILGRTGAADRGSCRVEPGEDTVAGAVQLAAAELLECVTKNPVVAGQELPPAAIAHLLGHDGRTDNVREQQRRQYARIPSLRHAASLASRLGLSKPATKQAVVCVKGLR